MYISNTCTLERLVSSPCTVERLASSLEAGLSLHISPNAQKKTKNTQASALQILYIANTLKLFHSV